MIIVKMRMERDIITSRTMDKLEDLLMEMWGLVWVIPKAKAGLNYPLLTINIEV